MLLGGIKPDIKQVAVVTRNQKFNKLMSSILADWKFFTVGDLSAAKVILVERGLELPAHDGHVIWLTPMPLTEGSFLTVPVSLNRLYHLLQSHFFSTPRRHIRVVMEASVALSMENALLEGRLISLSDRGGRLTCVREMPRGQLLNLQMELAGRVFRVPSEVLYCIPAGDSPGRSQPQIGVIFRPPNDQEFSLLRCFIEKTCVESACAREGILFNDPCLSWFDLPTDLWEG